MIEWFGGVHPDSMDDARQRQSQRLADWLQQFEFRSLFCLILPYSDVKRKFVFMMVSIRKCDGQIWGKFC